MYRSELVHADTASLGENSVLLAVPSPHIFDSVKAVGESAPPIEGAARPPLVRGFWGRYELPDRR